MRNGTELLQAARQEGISLYFTPEKQIRYQDMKGTITRERVDFLRSNKEALSEALETETPEPYAGTLRENYIEYVYHPVLDEVFLIAPDGVVIPPERSAGRVVYSHSEVRAYQKSPPSPEAFRAIHEIKKLMGGTYTVKTEGDYQP